MKNFRNGKKKAVTFSFDDGNVDDLRLIEILNKYGLKCTFNLNSGKMLSNDYWNHKGKEVRHLNYIGNEHAYDGHEIACHSYTHPHLEELNRADMLNQTALDKKILSYLYDCDVKGMAYPYGSYNDDVIEVLKECGIVYCRTVNSTYGYELPQNLLLLDPTCHFKEDVTFELAEKFVALKPDSAKMLYIWGHSYELITEDDWQRFDDLCRLLSGHDDIWYATNIEIAEDM